MSNQTQSKYEFKEKLKDVRANYVDLGIFTVHTNSNVTSCINVHTE